MKRALRGICVVGALMYASALRAEEPAGDWSGFCSVKSMSSSICAGRLAAAMRLRPRALIKATPSPVAKVDATPDHLKLVMTDVGVTYEGTWDANAQAWSGTLSQSGKASLILTLLDPASLAAMRPKRPQDVAAKAALMGRHNEEVSIPSSSAPGVVLAGTLTTPVGPGPFPAAILIAGSGPQTRDEEVARHKIFLVLADELTRRGIAVLRYDKRGVGASKGMYASATTADFASDANAVVQYLTHRPDIDRKHIGLIGHSEGGAIAPIVAAENPAVTFVVLMAGPGLRGSEMLLRQQALIAEADGASASAIARQAVRTVRSSMR